MKRFESTDGLLFAAVVLAAAVTVQTGMGILQPAAPAEPPVTVQTESAPMHTRIPTVAEDPAAAPAETPEEPEESEESEEPEEPEDALPDPDEEEQIIAALLMQGYLREDVPLSYTLQDNLHAACDQYGVPYELALGLIETESNFKSNIVSSSGAQGLMQLLPMYFGYGLSDVENINKGVEFLGSLYEKYGNWPAALTCFNIGHLTSSRTYANRVISNAIKWGWTP